MTKVLGTTQILVHVSGRVQGVSYRAYCCQQARDLGLRGWVRNLPDGRVQAMLQGPSEVVERMIAWCHRGSPHAAVTGVETEVQVLEVLEEFTTRA
jgi:acylphosphatase